jgi:hypothetical protein
LEIDTVAEVMFEPEILLASDTAFLMDFEASSMFVMAPFLMPWDLETP